MSDTTAAASRQPRPRRVGVLLFDGVEPLDFAGPYEVLSGARGEQGESLFEVHTVAETSPVNCQFGLRVLPDWLLSDAPPFDVLVVPGGPGTRATPDQLRRATDYIRATAEHAELVAGVCTGTILMALAGLTAGRRVTTHHRYRETLRERFGDLTVTDDRVLQDGKIITAAGVSSGIDMALYLVELLHGRAAADRERQRIEYGLHL